ncbi:hypothetical protein BSFA1_65730 (plasmid) [Burkholderia sp. SFA1]|nr:hypothetical protein BSFA1_65730 [Burkholderia sp. SFA1]
MFLLAFERIALAPQAIGEIDRSTQKRSKVADWVFRATQMSPTCFDNVGQQFAVKLGFAHEFEDQEFTKAQRQQTLEVGGEASWLSLLSFRD